MEDGKELDLMERNYQTDAGEVESFASKLARAGIDTRAASGKAEVSKIAGVCTVEAIETLYQVMTDEKVRKADRLSAANALLDRGHGKPATRTEETSKRTLHITVDKSEGIWAQRDTIEAEPVRHYVTDSTPDEQVQWPPVAQAEPERVTTDQEQSEEKDFDPFA